MTSRLGPLVATGDGSRLDAADGRGCRFTRAGVELAGPGGHREAAAWADVHELTVTAPTSWRWLRAAPAILLAVTFLDTTGASVRDKVVTVHVGGRWGDGPSVDLGRPVEAPYRSRELDALDALLAVLAERRRLAALGDPALVPTLLDAAAGAARRPSPLTDRKVRAAVTDHLPSRP